MSDWWTYRPADFLLFSETAYWRLFELHNKAVWPVQIAAAVAGLVIIFLFFRPRPWTGRAVGLVAASAWAFVAWAYFWDAYATINWAARYIAPLFLLQAVLLAWVGLFGGLGFGQPINGPKIIGLALFDLAWAVYPFLSIAAGRPLAGGEIFGIAPDPTAIATLGLILMAHPSRASWLLITIPAVWCVVTWATLAVMGTWQAWLPLVAAALALAAMARRGTSWRRAG